MLGIKFPCLNFGGHFQAKAMGMQVEKERVVPDGHYILVIEHSGPPKREQ